MVEKPDVEPADIALIEHELADATRQYHEPLGSEDLGSG